MKYHLLSFFRKNQLQLIASLVAAVFYFVIISQLGLYEYVKTFLYFAGDACEYRDYTLWLTGESNYCNPVRTFFYPLVLLLSTKLLGYYGIWYVQFLLWLAACNLIFQTTLRLTGKTAIALFSFIIAVLNLSLIVYTAHALAETFTFFLLTALAYLLSHLKGRFTRTSFLSGIILLLSILVATKPIYLVIWYIAIVIILIANRSILKKPLLIILLIASSTPVIIQKIINHTKHKDSATSKIANYNLKEYFYRKTKFIVEIDTLTQAQLDYIKNDTMTYYEQINQKFASMPESIRARDCVEAEQLSNQHIYGYLFKNFKYTLWVYWNNLKENLYTGNYYISWEKNPGIKRWIERYNEKFYSLHLFMFCVWIYYLIRKLRERRSGEYLFVLFTGILSFYILFSSGITFWAGDRLVIPALAIWSSLYPLMIYSIYKYNKTAAEQAD